MSVAGTETGEGSPATPSSDDADGSGSLTYYLLIDGMNGGSTSALYPGAFEIDGYAIDIEALAGGSAVFSPLEVDLDLGTALPGLAEAIASGEHIPAVQLVGVTGEGNTVYDLRLNDALVSDYTDADTGPDHLAFSYQTISLTTTPGDGLGGLGAPTVFGWDVSTQRRPTKDHRRHRPRMMRMAAGRSPTTC